MKPRTLFLCLMGLLGAAIYAENAHAATGLPMVCTSPAEEGKPVNSACGGRAQTGQIYRTPLPTDLVRTRSDGAHVADWDSNAYVWKAWSALAQGEYYDQCQTDVPEGSSVPDGTCTNWAMQPRASSPATFTATPTAGNAPLQVTITWNVPSGTQCAAGGAWTGAKSSGGTEVVTLQATGTLSIACSVPGVVLPGQATFNWVPSTQNSDGTTYTNPKGFYLYSGPASPAANKSPLLTPPTLRSYVLKDLPAGSTLFASIAAVSTADIEGDRSAEISAVIKGTATTQPWTASVPITVTPPVRKPKAPTLQVIGE